MESEERGVPFAPGDRGRTDANIEAGPYFEPLMSTESSMSGAWRGSDGCWIHWVKGVAAITGRAAADKARAWSFFMGFAGVYYVVEIKGSRVSHHAAHAGS